MTALERLTDARGAAVERIAQTAEEQSFTGIVGEADIGKTALLHAALDALRDSWTIVTIDLDGAWSPNRLAWRWARELARSVAGSVVISHLDALDRTMWPASTRAAILRVSSELGSDVAQLAEAQQPPRGVGKPDVMDGPAVATLELASRRRLLLVIDHLEAPRAAGLKSPDSEQLLWRLRARGQYERNFHLLVCARPPARDLAAGPSAAYHLDGRWLTLEAPTAGELSQATGADLATAEAVYARTAGHPRASIEVLTELARLPLKERPPVDATIAAIADRHVDLTRRSVQHARAVHRLGGHLLQAIAQGFGPYQATREIGAGEISDAMTRLHLNGLVRRAGPRDWAPSDPRVEWNLGGATVRARPTVYSAGGSRERLSGGGAARERDRRPAWNELTARQRRVLEQVMEGHSNAEIADALGLSVSTVKSHLRGVYRRLGVGTRGEALSALGDTAHDAASSR
jgi:DNA-binding CsgD family transcriptional regulator